MTYLISYDVSNDGIRTKMAKLLEKHGCYRVQKSVFVAPDFNLPEITVLRGALRRLVAAQKLEPTDSVLCVPIERDLTQDVVWAGEATAWQAALEKIRMTLL